MSLSFIRGLVATVNPCAFILLPTYLMYFLGLQGTMPGTQRATVRRALLVSAAVSAGFMSVFFIAGVISYNFTTWINENSKYATGAIGLALLVLGVAMLFGYKLPFATPRLDTGEKDRTVRSMFVYGVAYAVASIGCTIGLFIATVFSTTARDGVVQGVGNVVAYGAGMALLVSALTVSLSLANTGLLKLLRSGLAYVDRVAAAFVLLSGLYLLWYFYWVDLREEGDPITDWAEQRQAEATTFLNDNWTSVALVMLCIVGAAVAYVVSRTWRHLGYVAAAGLVATLALLPILGDDVWRVALITFVSVGAGAIGVSSAMRDQDAAADDEAAPVDPLGADADAEPSPGATDASVASDATGTASDAGLVAAPSEERATEPTSLGAGPPSTQA